MDKKCPYCGAKISTDEKFCPYCNHKIVVSNKKIIENKEKEYQRKEIDIASKQKIAKTTEEDLSADTMPARSVAFIDNNPTKNYNRIGFVIKFALYVTLAIICFSFSINSDLLKQNQRTEAKTYMNYINNPQEIPEFKEPKQYKEMIKNFEEVNNFLYLYLRYSTDTQEEKNRIFVNYLNELEKISYLSNDNIDSGEIKECSSIKNSNDANRCTKALNKKLKKTAVFGYVNNSSINFSINYTYLKNKYSKFLDENFKNYLALNSKYSALNNDKSEVIIYPKIFANKIADTEAMVNKMDNDILKEKSEKILFYDIRKFIFSRDIFATTTREMKPQYKIAYEYYIKNYKISSLKPLIMSYLDKQSSYTEENFRNDYPYRIFENQNNGNIENYTFKEIFNSLKNRNKKPTFGNNYKYIVNSKTMSIRLYNQNEIIGDDDYLISKIDGNNNISIYDKNNSKFQDLNVQSNSQFFTNNEKLYIYNKNKLAIFSMSFNGRSFMFNAIHSSEASNLFPGTRVIAIDSSDTYNIQINKPNSYEQYIILADKSQGWEDYMISATQGSATMLLLPTMFSVNQTDDVAISFHSKGISPIETSEARPTYKINIYTIGHHKDSNEIVNYDERTRQENMSDSQFNSPQKNQDINIKPDTNNNSAQQNSLQGNIEPNTYGPPPSQNIEPPKDD